MAEILIKGMEMPKTCRRCIEMGIPVRCRVMKQEAVTAVMSGFERPSDCPLVEVPPHGRLGDMDALVSNIKNVYCKDCKRSKVMCKACEYGDILDEIEDAPTIIEASEEGE